MNVQVISVISSALVAISSSTLLFLQHRETKKFELKLKEIEFTEKKRVNYTDEMKDVIISLIEAAYAIDVGVASKKNELWRLLSGKIAVLQFYDPRLYERISKLLKEAENSYDDDSKMKNNLYDIIDIIIGEYNMPSIEDKSRQLFG